MNLKPDHFPIVDFLKNDTSRKVRRKRCYGIILRSEDEFFRRHEMRKLPPLSCAGGTSFGFFVSANPDESAGHDPGSLSADFLLPRNSIFKEDAAVGRARFAAGSFAVPRSGEDTESIHKNADETGRRLCLS